ncbi:hypothetical protein ACWEGX_26940 [Streptomyces chartreusis]
MAVERPDEPSPDTTYGSPAVPLPVTVAFRVGVSAAWSAVPAGAGVKIPPSVPIVVWLPASPLMSTAISPVAES